MSGRILSAHAVEIVPPDAYRETEWHEARRSGIGASEIAAVLGISPWVSAFDLWWSKRSGVDSQPPNRAMSRGRRYEALILDDFAAGHPEFVLGSAGLCRNVDRPWQICTPDALAHESEAVSPDTDLEPVAVVEAKSGARRDQWGAPGTDEVPVHYRAQALWQCDIFGFERTFVPVVFGFDYAEYVIEWDEADALLMRQAAEEFLTSVRQDRQPDVDAHVATTRRLRLLHPELDDVETEVDPRVVEQYRVARRLRDRASDRLRLAENRLRGQMGDAHTAVVDGHKVGSRSLSDIKERTQTVRAHRQDRLYIKEPK